MIDVIDLDAFDALKADDQAELIGRLQFRRRTAVQESRLLRNRLIVEYRQTSYPDLTDNAAAECIAIDLNRYAASSGRFSDADLSEQSPVACIVTASAGRVPGAESIRKILALVKNTGSISQPTESL